MKPKTCPVCNCNNVEPIFLRKDLRYMTTDEQFLIVRCTKCSMAYVYNPPFPEDMSKIYPDQFYADNKSNYFDNTPLKNKLAWLPSTLGSVLDIGCAGGEFVSYAANKGWSAQGFDWNTNLNDEIFTCQQEGGSAKSHVTVQNNVESNIYYGKSLAIHFHESNSFDVITMWAVLEHVWNLQEIMGEVQRLLRPGGTFIALVTNFNSIPARYMRQDDIPRHLNLFTKKSLTQLLTQYDLKPQTWSYDNTIFSGSHRGLLVFLAKRLSGESMEAIVRQHRSPEKGQREEFCTMLHKKPSAIIRNLCTFDSKICKHIDKVAEWLRLGFIMTVSAKKT